MITFTGFSLRKSKLAAVLTGDLRQTSSISASFSTNTCHFICNQTSMTD